MKTKLKILLALAFGVFITSSLALEVTAADVISVMDIDAAIQAADVSSTDKTVVLTKEFAVTYNVDVPNGVTVIIAKRLELLNKSSLIVHQGGKVIINPSAELHTAWQCPLNVETGGEVVNDGVIYNQEAATNNGVIRGNGALVHFWKNEKVLPNPAVSANYYMQWFKVSANGNMIKDKDLQISCPISPWRTPLTNFVWGIALPANQPTTISFGAAGYDTVTGSYTAIDAASIDSAEQPDLAHTVNLLPTPPAPVYQAPVYESSGRDRTSSGGGSSGGGGGGSSFAPSIASSETTQSTLPVEEKTALAVADKAIKNAKAGSRVYVKLQGNSVTKEIMAKLKAKATNAGVTVLVVSSTKDADKVVAQLSINPALVTTDLKLGVELKSAAVTKRKAQFEKQFSNKVEVISFSQKNDFGQKVHVAALVDLKRLNSKNLVFYSYDSISKKLAKIATTYRVDKNGYLQFDTSLAGDIIISDGVLTKR